MEDQLDLALLVLRLVFGVCLAVHGYNKVFGGGGLAGTARWFELDRHELARPAGPAGRGDRDRHRAAVRRRAAHPVRRGRDDRRDGGGQLGRPPRQRLLHLQGGWEYVAAIAVVAWAVATIGPGRFSLDHAIDIDWTGWSGSLIAALLGVGSGAAQLAVCYRPAVRRGRMREVLADRHRRRRRRVRGVLGVGAVLRLQGGGQQDRRPGLGRAGRGDLRGRRGRARASWPTCGVSTTTTRRCSPSAPTSSTRRPTSSSRCSTTSSPCTPTDDKGLAIVPQWEADYRTYLENRRAFTDALRAGENEPFTEAAVDGIPISEKLEQFAGDNEMPSCAPPRDLAN